MTMLINLAACTENLRSIASRQPKHIQDWVMTAAKAKIRETLAEKSIPVRAPRAGGVRFSGFSSGDDTTQTGDSWISLSVVAPSGARRVVRVAEGSAQHKAALDGTLFYLPPTTVTDLFDELYPILDYLRTTYPQPRRLVMPWSVAKEKTDEYLLNKQRLAREQMEAAAARARARAQALADTPPPAWLQETRYTLWLNALVQSQLVGTVAVRGCMYAAYVLLGEDALEYESTVMHHCVRDYTNLVKAKHFCAISLRDSDGRSCATLEIRRAPDGRATCYQAKRLLNDPLTVTDFYAMDAILKGLNVHLSLRTPEEDLSEEALNAQAALHNIRSTQIDPSKPETVNSEGDAKMIVSSVNEWLN